MTPSEWRAGHRGPVSKALAHAAVTDTSRPSASVPLLRATVEQGARGLLGLFERAHAAVELQLVDGARDLADEGRRVEAHLQEVAAHEYGRGRLLPDGQLACTRDEP